MSKHSFNGPNKQIFSLPVVRDKADRFCFFCGMKMRGNWPKCDDCQKPAKQTPPPPEGWFQCPTCKIGLLEEGDHFCRLCHYRTVLGRDWNTALNQQNRDFERQRALLDSQYGINALRVKRVCLGSEVAGRADGATDGSEEVEGRRREAVEGVVVPGGVDVGQGAATGVVGDFDGEDIDKILKEI